MARNFGNSNFLDDITVADEMKGARLFIGAGTNGSISHSTSDSLRYLKGYNGMTMTDTRCWCMTRAGSIVGLSATFNENTHTVNGDIEISIRKNGVEAYKATYSSTATGDHKMYDTQVRGTDTFSAGDLLSFKVNFSGGYEGTTNDWQALCGIQFNE